MAVASDFGACVRQSDPKTSAGGRLGRVDTSLELLLEHSRQLGRDRVLATIVRTAGSTYRKAGARMLLTPQGDYVGLLTGGCFEADLLLHAEGVHRNKTAQLIEYDMRSSDDALFGIGAGCEGALSVLLEPAGTGSAAELVLEKACIESLRQATPIIVVYESTDWRLGTYSASELPPMLLAAAAENVGIGGSGTFAVARDGRVTCAYVQNVASPPQLLICGAGRDARPLVSLAVALGWRVMVLDHRPAYLAPECFAGADTRLADLRNLHRTVNLERYDAAVVMSHHLPSDVSYLGALAGASRPGYIGLLGPTVRRDRIVRDAGVSGAIIGARLRGPVGLDIGAVTPESIALAIISEIHAWLAGRIAIEMRSKKLASTF